MNQFSSSRLITKLFIKLTIMTLFWNSITKDTNTFANILKEHKNKSLINVSIEYPNNNDFFLESDIEHSDDISIEAYEEIQDNLEWSYKLPSFHDNISKRIDDYYVNRYNSTLVTYLYDQEEQEWDKSMETNYNDYEEVEEVEEIEM